MIQTQTFGSFSILVNGHVAHQKLGRIGSDLAAFMMVNPSKRYRRDKLLEMFWGHLEESKARHAMNTALWRLRAIFGLDGGVEETAGLHCDAGQITFLPPRSLVVDATELAQCVQLVWASWEKDQDSVSITDRKSLNQVLGLYQGPFLEHSDADWAIETRDYLQTLYVRGLTLLIGSYTKENRFEKALDCTRRILSVDPLRESVQRHAMRLLVLNDQRAEAIRQYRHCYRMLKEEFGVDPMPDTENLYRQILSGDIFSVLDREKAKIHT